MDIRNHRKMSEQKQTVESQLNKQNQQKNQPDLMTEQTEEQSVLEGLSKGLVGSTNNASIQAQAARLGDTRLQTVQRQAIATQIGRSGGNHYLQRVMAQMKQNESTVNSMRRDSVFGTEQLLSESQEGKKLLAHELVYVVKQSQSSGVPGPQRKPQESPKSKFAPEFDMQLILGPKVEEKSVVVDQARLLKLYKYLKRIRRTAPALEQPVKNILERYFPGAGDKVWEASKKPFAGYMGTRYQSRLGLKGTGKGRWVKKFFGSDILFFSGHHYGAPGYRDPGGFDYLDLKKLRIRRRPAKFERVKLIMISSCSVLRKSALPTFRRRFPNAYILGWYAGAPYRQSYMMTKFLSKLPEDLILEDPNDMGKILKLWEAFAENLEKENVKLRHSTGRKATRWGLGYATPDGIVKYMKSDKKGRWVWKTESR
jgi:hypothetical protein